MHAVVTTRKEKIVLTSVTTARQCDLYLSAAKQEICVIMMIRLQSGVSIWCNN